VLVRDGEFEWFGDEVCWKFSVVFLVDLENVNDIHVCS
jgi:hypothetical protein